MPLPKVSPGLLPAENYRRFNGAFDQVDTTAARVEAVNTTIGGRVQTVAQRVEDVNSVLGLRLADLATQYGLTAAQVTEMLMAYVGLASGLPNLAGRADVADIASRPGDAYRLFTAQIEGRPSEVTPLDRSLVVTDSDGAVVRLVGAGRVGPIAATRLESGRVYLVRFAVRRRVDTGDPSNDAVRCAIRWLTPGKAALASAMTVVQDLNSLTTANGRTVVTVRVIAAPGAAAAGTLVAPAGAVYFRPYVECFGDATTDIEVIQRSDITEAGGVSVDLASYEARIQALEGYDGANRLNQIQAQLGGARLLDFLSRDMVQATTISATVNAIRIIRYDLMTPASAAIYLRVDAEPQHPRKVQSGDGAWWELSYRQDFGLEAQGARGDGSADDTTAVQGIFGIGAASVFGRHKVAALTAPRSGRLSGRHREFIAYPAQQGTGDAYVFPSSPTLADSSLEQTGSLTLAPGAILERMNVRPSGIVLPTPGAVYTAAQARAIASTALAAFNGTGLSGTGIHDSTFRDVVLLGHDQAVSIDFNGMGGRTHFQNMLVDGNGGFDLRNAGDVVGLFNTSVWPAVGASFPGVSPSSNFAQLQRRKPAYSLSGDPTKGFMDWAWMIAPFAYGHDQNYVFKDVANIRVVIPGSDYTFDNTNSIAGYTITGSSDNIQLVYPTTVGHKIGVIIDSTNAVDLAAAIQGGYFGNTDTSIDLRDGDMIAADMSLRAATVGLRVGANAGSFRFAPARSAVGSLVSFDPAWPSASTFGRIELPAMTTPAPVFAAALTDAQRKRLTILGATPQHGGVSNQMLRPLEIVSDGAAFSLWNTAASDPNSAIHDILSDNSGGVSFRGLTADRSAAVTVLRIKNGGLTPLGIDVAGPIAGTAGITAATTLQCGTYTVATLPTPGIKGRIAFASDARALVGGGTLQAAGQGTGAHVTDRGNGWVLAGTAFGVAA